MLVFFLNKKNGLINVYTITSLISNSEWCINIQPRQARPTLVNINSNQPLYYPFTFSVNKCAGSCNTIDDQYTQVCVPKKVKK